MSNLNLQKLREWVWLWPWTFKAWLETLSANATLLQLRKNDTIEMTILWQQPASWCLYTYSVLQKRCPFSFFHNSFKRRSICTKFLPDVAEKILIQNILTKYNR